MMEMLQGWLLGLTAAALAVSLLTAMLPKGETIRRIAGLAGGLILLLAVVQPLRSRCNAHWMGQERLRFLIKRMRSLREPLQPLRKLSMQYRGLS